jgi:hypothetical protein
MPCHDCSSSANEVGISASRAKLYETVCTRVCTCVGGCCCLFVFWCVCGRTCICVCDARVDVWVRAWLSGQHTHRHWKPQRVRAWLSGQHTHRHWEPQRVHFLEFHPREQAARRHQATVTKRLHRLQRGDCLREQPHSGVIADLGWKRTHDSINRQRVPVKRTKFEIKIDGKQREREREKQMGRGMESTEQMRRR